MKSMRMKIGLAAAASSLLLALAGCGNNNNNNNGNSGGSSGGGSSSSSSSGSGSSSSSSSSSGGSSSGAGSVTLSLSGTVIQAPLGGATVTAYAATSAGAAGTTALGSATTGSDGSFSLTATLPSGAAAPADLVLIATGGSYASEANTGTTVSNGTAAAIPGLSVLLPQVPAAGETGVVISPLTTLSASRAQGLIAGVNPSVNTVRGRKSQPRASCSGTALQCASSAADAGIEGAFGLSGVSGPLSTLAPDFTATSGNGAIFAVVLGALEEEALSQAQPPDLVIGALASDYYDGIPDGKGPGGGPVTFPGTTTTVPGSLGSSIFLSGMTTYVNNSSSPPAGVTTASNGVPISSTVSSSIRGGIASVAPASAALSTSSSGAVSEIIDPSSGHQIVLVAARAFGLQGLDISNPTSPALNGYAALNTALAALKDGSGNPSIPTVDAVTAIPGQADAEAVLSSFATAHVILVDIDKQTVLRDSDFSGTLTTQTGFSGGSAYISSSIYDSSIGADGGVLLATGNGFFAYDVGAGTLGTPIALPVDSSSGVANTDYPAENLGGATADTTIFAGGLLLNGNYGPDGSGGALDLVDIAGGNAYALTDAQFQTNLAIPESGGSEPFSTVDGNSVDTVYHVGLLTGEDQSYMGFIDLHSASAYTFTGTGANGSFSAASPATVLLGQELSDDLGSPTLSGSAVEATNHLVLGIAAFSYTLLVGSVDNPAAPANGKTWAGLTDWRYWNDDGTDYVSTAADPHAVGALLATGNNRSYGVTLSINGSAETVILIDLQAFLSAAAAPVPSGGTLPHEHELAANPFGTSIIQTIALTNTFSPSVRGKKLKTQLKKGYMVRH